MNKIKALLVASGLALALILSATANYLVPGAPPVVFGQTYATNTTLSAAVTSASATTIRVTSATGFTVGYTLYLDGEAMSINAVSGTTITVFRGAFGTMAGTHANGATVIVGPPSMFSTMDPPMGSCTPGNYANLPLVNIITGDVWICRYVASSPMGGATNRIWTATNARNKTYNSLLLTLS